VADQFEARYILTDPDDEGYDDALKDVTIDHISGCEYWLLNRTVGASTVSVRLTWDVNSCGVDDLGDLIVSRWDGSMWKDNGSGGTTGDVNAGTVVSSAAIDITTNTPFTLGSTTTDNPLPVKLLFFGAKYDEGIVKLNWSTASETYNDYFTIEKTKDGQDFEEVIIVKGAGNSNSILEYNATDNEPYEGLSYYRLTQTDFDGRYTYSDLVSVNVNTNEDKIIFYPNPTNNMFNVILPNNETVYIDIYNTAGVKLYSNTFDNSSANNILSLNIKELLKAGIFIIHATNRNNTLHYYDKVVVY